ncbi:MAG TPA: acetyl-CoA carboxylase biotin carboxyl carrier protein [Elusimicrobia bacterium]|nr:acetyl-CoA carboxylase biotin carboxyl carrier protein [Elusimicrobiota bacterium]HBW22709.1 acetyl-CoA carboxylase biotin carboxyl carrier protein [Elusimicrobiota bacterium]
MKKLSPEKNPKQLETAFEQVQKFYQFMNANKLEVVEFSKDATYIKLVRKHNQTVQPIPVFAAHAPAAPAAAAKTGPAAAPAVRPAPEGETIKAPMSGIFYRAPSPSSPPYVREGDAVKEGQVICVLEAMKVFNELKAEKNCVIEKVLSENGKPVEPNQDLFLIK